MNSKKKLSKNQIIEIWKDKIEKIKPDDDFTLYIDSPFCFNACKFCIYDPTVIDNNDKVKLKNIYYEKLIIQQIEDFKEVISARKVDAIYFGGGTSSLMSIKQMETIFKTLQKHFDFLNLKEKHFEFNPFFTTDEKIDYLLSWNFSDFTFGYQTFNKDVLKFNGRKNVGYSNLKKIFEKLEKEDVNYNIDLLAYIYKDDLVQDLKILKKDLDIVNTLQPRRITVFPNYKKIPIEGFMNKDKEIFQKIGIFRKAVHQFCQSHNYTNTNEMIESYNLENIKYDIAIRNGILLRNDTLDKTDWKYECTGPEYTRSPNQICVAFGGFKERKPYSYFKNELIYENEIDEKLDIKYSIKKNE